MTPKTTSLSAALRPFLKEMETALTEISRGESGSGEVGAEALNRALDGAIRTAVNLAPETPGNRWNAFSSDMANVIADNFKALREESGWSQARLAEAMELQGFSWQRITVTMVEATNRRLDWEELIAVAVLFGVPVMELLTPGENIWLDWHNQDLSSATVVELFVGSGGRVGTGGVTWVAAAKAAGAPRGKGDTRPAADLWSNRSQTSRGSR